MLNFLQYIKEEFLLEERKVNPANEEHVVAHAWNHLVGNGIVKHGEDNTEAINSEIEKAKKNKNHPLHVSKAAGVSGMFRGGKVDADSYHRELENAGRTINTWAQHPKLKKAIKKGHTASVLGSARGELSDTWQKHGATGSATKTSKADLVIKDPKGKAEEGINLSLKKTGGSQLVAAQSKENMALHDHAARTMIAEHHSHLSQKEQDAIHGEIMSHASYLSGVMRKMKGRPKAEQDEMVKSANKKIKAFHGRYPHLNFHLRKEAATGMGKFGGSGHSAHYFGKIATGKGEASINHHEDEEMHNVYNGPLPRMSIGAHPRINSKGKPATQREGRLRMDVPAEKKGKK